MFKILEDIGFSQADAKVYIYLAKTRPQKSEDLAIGLKMTQRQLHPVLKSLQEKGVVTNSPEHPGLFSALAFEELIELYVKVSVEQAQTIRETKEELLASWRKMTAKNNS